MYFDGKYLFLNSIISTNKIGSIFSSLFTNIFVTVLADSNHANILDSNLFDRTFANILSRIIWKGMQQVYLTLVFTANKTVYFSYHS